MMSSKKSTFALLVGVTLLMAACSGLKATSGGGGGGGTTTATIGGTVTGLQGSGLVLLDNGQDALTISASGSFTFKTALTLNTTYMVTVQTQPSNPSQNCTVAGGQGTATANVTTVQVNCATGAVTVGAQVTGLSGKGLVLQDNGNAQDNLTINAPGTYTFTTQVVYGNTYNVTVLQQPTSPSQTCTVANPSGTASQSVGNVVVSVTCSTGTLSIGGSISGLAGSGLVLQDNGGDNLTITANGNFTFVTLLAGGQTYNVTILTQPTGPAQTCTVTNGQGTATANVSNIQIVCPAVFHTIGGQVVGLYVPSGGNANMILQNNGGDNLPIEGDGAFTFVTPIANGSYYDVDIFQTATTQPQGCRIYFYEGQALSDVTSVVVDCGHNDWAWVAGSKTANQNGSSSPPSTLPPTTIVTSSPGGTRYPATWTDINGNLWIFGGKGYSTNTTAAPQPWWYQELWEYQGTGLANYEGSYNQYWTLINENSTPAGRWGAVTWVDASGTEGRLWLFGGQDQFTNFLNDLWVYDIGAKTWTQVAGGANQPGVYGTKGTPTATNLPGGRWGASFRQDPATGTVWMFGGYGCDSTGPNCSNGLLNDLWKYSGGQWTWVSGSNIMNEDGVYGTEGTAAAANVPGGRQASVAWIDKSGNFWLFGGYNLSGTGQPNAFNDLWEFSGGQWTWVSGANTVNQTAVYGTQGIAATTNVPGARWSPAAWSDTDLTGNTRLWLFGGQGYDATGNGSLGDLWEFTPNQGGASQNQWTWVKGPNSVSQAGVYGLAPTPIIWPYGAEGIPGNPPNNPGSRWGAGYWTDLSGQFWMFGGEGFDSSGTNGDGYLNDLFRYLPYPDATND